MNYSNILPVDMTDLGWPSKPVTPRLGDPVVMKLGECKPGDRVAMLHSGRTYLITGVAIYDEYLGTHTREIPSILVTRLES